MQLFLIYTHIIQSIKHLLSINCAFIEKKVVKQAQLNGQMKLENQKKEIMRSIELMIFGRETVQKNLETSKLEGKRVKWNFDQLFKLNLGDT